MFGIDIMGFKLLFSRSVVKVLELRFFCLLVFRGKGVGMIGRKLRCHSLWLMIHLGYHVCTKMIKYYYMYTVI